MLKSLAFATLFTFAAAVNAQSPDLPPAPDSTSSQPPAPIVRAYQTNLDTQPNSLRRSRRSDQNFSRPIDSHPISGVWLRSTAAGSLKTISTTQQRTEIRLDQGILNVNVHHPADHSEILIDLPGGQTSLLKDGLYTFNADTNTVRVLHGEAAAYSSSATGPGIIPGNKPVKIKEAHQLAFTPAPGTLKAVEAYPYELSADLLPLGNRDSSSYADYSGDYGPYVYPYPYYAGGWGYPYGFYPYSVGLGFGYGYFGGFHGFYRGGFHR